MIISEINLRNESGVVRAEAQVTWEEADKPPVSFFVETEAQFQDVFWADPNGFLVAALLPAWHAGERRVKIDAALCPVLCSNLNAAVTILKTWFPEFGTPPNIEPLEGFKVFRPFQTQAASFLSCGIDSLATLRWNRLHLPADHPASIKAVIPIDYISAPGISQEEALNRTQKRLDAAACVAADAGVTMIPLRTNVLRLEYDGWFFAYKWYGAVLSSLAYFLSKGFNKVSIASGGHIMYLVRWGSHPMLDPYYSSAYLQIEHHGSQWSRFEKTALLAEWPVGLQNILVCEGKDSGESNCGSCEKCIRTMTSLVALGKLKDSHSFPEDDVSPELLRTVQEYDMLHDDGAANYYREMIPGLMKYGRADLVAVIEQILLSYAQKSSRQG